MSASLLALRTVTVFEAVQLRNICQFSPRSPRTTQAVTQQFMPDATAWLSAWRKRGMHADFTLLTRSEHGTPSTSRHNPALFAASWRSDTREGVLQDAYWLENNNELCRHYQARKHTQSRYCAMDATSSNVEGPCTKEQSRQTQARSLNDLSFKLFFLNRTSVLYMYTQEIVQSEFGRINQRPYRGAWYTVLFDANLLEARNKWDKQWFPHFIGTL